jgi:hypothetical protein
MSNSIFSKNGHYIKVDRDPYESNDMYHERGWFIVSQLVGDETDNLEEYIKYSRIWCNTKFMNVQYGDKVMKKLEDMIKKLHS